MKPPIDPRYPHYEDRGFIHWDLDTSQPLPERRGVQGVLALTDTTARWAGSSVYPASTASSPRGSGSSLQTVTPAAPTSLAYPRAVGSHPCR